MESLLGLIVVGSVILWIVGMCSLLMVMIDWLNDNIKKRVELEDRIETIERRLRPPNRKPTNPKPAGGNGG